MPAKPKNLVYRLKITLLGSEPPIWRMVEVPASVSLDRLHTIIQIAMGWQDCHLHQFIIEEKNYGVPGPDDWEPVLNERRYRLSQVAPSARSQFVYEYDFGDSWEHQIVVEKILPAEPGVKYPVCVKGQRACPPEDVGGVWGYEEFLEIMKDPEHEEHDEYFQWYGGEFDPEAFDIEAVNRVLRRIT